MSILDDLPGIMADAMGEVVFRPAILHKINGRTSDGQGGYVPSRTAHDCRGLVVDYSDYAKLANGIPAKTRQALILASTIDVVPKSGDILVIRDEAWAIGDVTSDPSNATYTAQCTAAKGPV